MFNKIAYILAKRLQYFMDSSARESVYNVYVDLARSQMADHV